MHNNNYKSWNNLRNDIGNLEHVFPDIEYGKLPLTFKSSINNAQVKFTKSAWGNGNLYYSYDNITWTTYTDDTFININNKIYFKGDLCIVTPTPVGGAMPSPDGIGSFALTHTSTVEGNVMSLIYNDNFINQLTITDNQVFYNLFNGCTTLIDASNLILLATTLTNNCYSYMFSGCTSLTKAPELPATTLANYCYSYMFSSCTSLTNAPALPSTTLTNGCYYNMFYNCTSLIKALDLPAITLAQSCYANMFEGCTSLTKAPTLPATTLAYGCYYNMFYNCTSLTKVPALQATTLANSCYQYMFQGCTSLTTAPTLLATTLANQCYYQMFQGCISLTKAPTLPATTLANSCYSSMFRNCTSLTTAPDLPATTLVSNCYSNMFYGCSKLNYIKALFTTTPSNSYTQNWVTNVASTGTFIKSDSATWTTTGTNAVPTSWTVYKESEEPYDIIHHFSVGNSSLINSKTGTFTFSGKNYLKSNEDYVGIQIGSAGDKMQITVFDSCLQWRNNDTGGNNTSWQPWKKFLDTNNLTTYSYQKSPNIFFGSNNIGFPDTHSFLSLDLTDQDNISDYPYLPTSNSTYDTITYVENYNNSPMIFGSNLDLRDLSSGNYHSIIAGSYQKIDSEGNITIYGDNDDIEEFEIINSYTYNIKRNKYYLLGEHGVDLNIYLDEPSSGYKNIWTFGFDTPSDSIAGDFGMFIYDYTENSINDYMKWQDKPIYEKNCHYEISINCFKTISGSFQYYGTITKWKL